MIRPPMFKATTEHDTALVAAEEDELGVKEQGPEKPDLTRLDALFLKTSEGAQGVFQVYRASWLACVPTGMMNPSKFLSLGSLASHICLTKVPSDKNLEGYRILLRAEEVWALLKRGQKFYNWATKLMLGCK